MAATALFKIWTGTDAGTMSPATTGDGDNWNLMNSDEYDSTGTGYQSSPITVPAEGTAYSYERWVSVRFDGTFNAIENVKAWKSAGDYSDVNLSIKAGETDTGATPVNTASSIADTTIPTSEGSAIDITPSGGIEDSEDFTDYLVMQLNVPSTVTTPGDIGSQTLTISYDES